MTGGLPRSLVDLIDVVGVEGARRIVERWGGTRLWVPRSAAGHELADVVGEEASGRLCRAWGGEAHAIPRAVALERAERDRRIRGLHEAGMSAAEIARQERITIGRVYQILAAAAD